MNDLENKTTYFLLGPRLSQPDLKQDVGLVLISRDNKHTKLKGDYTVLCENKELEKLREENRQMREVLEKIADPRKRDHQEPDAYTQLACVMNMADEVLKEIGE